MSTNAAVYIRVDTQGGPAVQDTGGGGAPAMRGDRASLDLQRRSCTTHIGDMGPDWKLVHDVYNDNAPYFSDEATGTDGDQPAWGRLMRLARAHGVDTIVCLTLDRISTDQARLTAVLRELSTLGVVLHSITEGDFQPGDAAKAQATAAGSEQAVPQAQANS